LCIGNCAAQQHNGLANNIAVGEGADPTTRKYCLDNVNFQAIDNVMCG